jgi:hypothetical protein
MPIEEADLNPSECEILAHWRRHRPKMCREMESTGSLLDRVRGAAKERARLEALGSDPRLGEDGARELAREVWCFPDERDEPVLGGRMRYR